jgi:hypothetical protein
MRTDGAIADGPGGRRTVAQLIQSPEHAGSLQGAARLGEASADGRIVRIGVFPGGRARFRATTCAALIAYAEATCEALESGVAPAALDAAAIRVRVSGVHPGQVDRAVLVAAAVAAAFPEESP